MGYNTKQREAIFEILKTNGDGHFTAEDVLALLTSNGSGVGKSTVYRYLDKLVENGDVRKYVVQEGKSACYQFVGNDTECHNHYHLKCSECGALLHVDCNYLDKVENHILEHHGFKMNNEKTVLYGVCKDCAHKDTT